MSLHPNEAVDAAMRASIGSGSHFWDPGSMRFHGSRPVDGALSPDRTVAYVIERYRTVRMGGHVVQTPHDRLLRVRLIGPDAGDISTLGADGTWGGYPSDRSMSPRQARAALKRAVAGEIKDRA